MKSPDFAAAAPIHLRPHWRRWLVALTVIANLTIGAAWADDDSHAGDRKQMLALMKEVEAGINAQDVTGHGREPQAAGPARASFCAAAALRTVLRWAESLR